MMFNRRLFLISGLFAALATLNGCFLRSDNQMHTPDALVSLGIAYLQLGNLEKARSALNQALAADPRSPVSWGAMAYLEEISGNLTEAGNDYRRAIQLSPRQGEAHNNYGIFLCRHGQPRQGIQEFLKATQLPTYIYRAAAYENAGLCAQRIPDPAAAQTWFAAALRNSPERKF